MRPCLGGRSMGLGLRAIVEETRAPRPQYIGGRDIPTKGGEHFIHDTNT